MPRRKGEQRSRIITAQELDAKAAAGKDISGYFDADSGTKRLSVDLPIWAFRALDAEAIRIGIAPQALVKLWVAERLDGLSGARTRLMPSKKR
jgi:hypothetical protein